MQSIPGSSNPTNTTTSIGGGSRGGLARFRSAPVTWLDALLEEEEDEGNEDDPSKQNQCFTQLLTGNAPKAIEHESGGRGFSISYGGGGGGCDGVPVPGFLRQSSLPGDFLGNLGYGGGGKRGRDDGFASQVRGEERGVSSSSDLMDLEVDRLFEDSGAAPCKFRAKRGFATHPRSIAERVRRTRISDRIRKLQELMPHMDKQINTADMLDDAVEYVKLLQKQIKELSEQQRNCMCKPRECT
ncbi:hypothetical protein MLD38_033708 [Melastoma candidum]|uniref:Uncharacterized protein n=1 Tax=Melastoma candidum TaxID=119954 RepID=A0ACB9M7L6_9MYRT|nr:hypothetical protein MLD38_033708 [Melastoma candidum]